MSRTVIYSLIAACFVGVSILMLVLASQSHREYGHAHATANRALSTATNPSTLPGSLVSPEPFFRKAQRLTLGVWVLAVVALLAAVRTRHLAWLACFLVCGSLGVIALMKTGIRY